MEDYSDQPPPACVEIQADSARRERDATVAGRIFG